MPNKSGMNVQCYIDVKVIADLAFLIKEKGINTRGKISRMINIILKNVQENSCSYNFPDSELALEFLNSEGYSLAQLNPEDKRNGLSNDLRIESINFSNDEDKYNDPDIQKRAEEIAKALEENNEEDNDNKQS